ncbi:hypothetical protein N2V83_23840 [Bacillus sp. FSL M7-1431]|uniref:AIPR family protein n=2 Tax=Bacillaceae TaxID=186817 RepID=UPI0030FA02A9
MVVHKEEMLKIVALTTIKLRAKFARKMPDPIDPKKEHHFMWVAAQDFPESIPANPNPRPSNTDLAVYQEVLDSFLNRGASTPYTFHLKNKGLDIIASYVKNTEKDQYEVGFNPSEGLANGKHTFEIMKKNAKQVGDQYVLVKITTNVQPDFVAEMAMGLNTSVQVHTESILNQKGAFDWIKEVFKNESYANKISYVENLNLPMDIRELISIMVLFNIDINYLDGNVADKHPKYAYSAKAKCLSQFNEHPESFVKLRLILKDILVLHDTIKLEGPLMHNKQGGKAGSLGYVEKRTKSPIELIFIGKETKVYLSKGALFPVLAAFRWFVKEDPKSGLYVWKKKGGFDEILSVWRKHGPRLMSSVQSAYNAVGKDPNALGKNTVTWSSTYSELLSALLEEQDDN